MNDRVGLLLLNLGTPDAPRPREVRRYLREFLSDPRVLDLPPLRRRLLLELVILPLRPRRSAAAYRKVWREDGSPLLVHGRALAARVQALVGPAVHVELAMRYGNPSIGAALEAFAAAGARRLVVLPLFPQYSAAATGSAVAAVMTQAASRWDPPYLEVVAPFWSHPAYLEARAAVAAPFFAGEPPERVFMSFHGLPERQVRRSDRSGRCFGDAGCCATLGEHNRSCYRAQCVASARLLGERLGIDPARTVLCFQSRLGRTPWLRPYTDEVLAAEAGRGVRRAVILSPGFVTDCLETLEELGIRGAETWRAHGGETLTLVPALNDHPRFAEALVAIAADASRSFAVAVGEPASVRLP
jgi:ferrochelatase